MYTSDPANADLFKRVLDENRLNKLAPMKSLHDLGVRTALGTDWPVASAISTHKH